MPALHHWFSGAAVGAFIVLLGALATLGYNWFSAAKANETAEIAAARETATQADQARRAVLQVLTREYILSHDGITPAMMAGTELPPKDWLNQRLAELGETWRVD